MRYYFLGIGGIGMSALARFFHRSGHTVEGYDRTPSPLTEALQQEGISIHFDDRPDALPPDIDLAIYTPAIPDSLQELQALKKRGVPLKKRSQVLGELTRGKCCIAVAGSHGKTTTSTLIAHLLRSSGIGCSAFLGGISKNIGSNLVVDNKSPYIVVEADEYDRSFLQLHPHLSVITATDPDHLDVYGTHAAMLSAYAQFAKQTDADGHLFLHQGTFTQLDGSPYTEEHIAKEEPPHSDHHQHEEQPVHFPLAASYSTYTSQGIEADYYAINISTHRGDLFFDLRTPGGVLYDLQLCGQPLVNIENAVAASAVALMCGTQQEALREGLKSFCGVQRRFDYRIRTERLVYIDDYAHHPCRALPLPASPCGGHIPAAPLQPHARPCRRLCTRPLHPRRTHPAPHLPRARTAHIGRKLLNGAAQGELYE